MIWILTQNAFTGELVSNSTTGKLFLVTTTNTWKKKFNLLKFSLKYPKQKIAMDYSPRWRELSTAIFYYSLINKRRPFNGSSTRVQFPVVGHVSSKFLVYRIRAFL